MKSRTLFFGGLTLVALFLFGCKFGSTYEVTSISIKTEPTKTIYTVGEIFDPSGLVITANYENNTSEDITYSEDSGITFDLKRTKFINSGETKIKVIYQEKEATFTVTVKPTLESISVKAKPTKTDYTVGETFAPSGLVITATYGNNTSEDITYTEDSGITLSEPDMTKKGSKTVTVTFNGKTTNFNIEITEEVPAEEKTPDPDTQDKEQPENKIYKIDVSEAATKNSWYIAGISANDFSNKTVNITISAKMKVKNTGAAAKIQWTTNGASTYPTIASSTFEKGTSDWVTVTGTKENIQLSPYPLIYISDYGLTTSNLTIYVKELTITITEANSKTYTEFTSKNGVTEIQEDDVPAEETPVAVLSSISIKSVPTKYTYELNSTDIDLTGLILTEKYDDNTTKDITYSSSLGITTSNVDFSTEGSKTVTLTYKEKTVSFTISVLSNTNWLSTSVPSLKETYADQFDSIGIAAEYGNFGLNQVSSNKLTADYTWDGSTWGTPNELYYEEVQKGIAKQANSITLGNELKPQFVLQWWSGSINSDATLVDFTASNGQTIKVPSKLNGESLIYATLNVCKKMGVQMRGHVLTWHSQTPDGFFAENYTPTYNGDLISNMVSKEVMTARHEWYIKTVLGCVDAWEKANNYRAIWAWDVVNEAMADDAGKTYTGDNQNWLRGSTAGTKDKSPNNGGGSRWYQVYGNEEFIVNAFRFANAYAPSDVKLCYNDYNEYMDYHDSEHNKDCYKTSAIEHIVSCIKNGEAQTINGNSVAPRFDVIAMQSHVTTTYPGITSYENALKRFLALCDVHVSEIDFAAQTQEAATTAWADYFTMLQKYGKKSSGTHKVTNITIWGVNNENSWINPASAGGIKTYPLLFNIDDKVSSTTKTVTYDTGSAVLPCYDIGDTYEPNNAFWAIINAHK